MRGPMQDLGAGPLWAMASWRHRAATCFWRCFSKMAYKIKEDGKSMLLRWTLNFGLVWRDFWLSRSDILPSEKTSRNCSLEDSYRPAKSITNVEITRNNGTRTNQCWFANRNLRRLALEKHPARCNAWNSDHLIAIKLRSNLFSIEFIFLFS